MQPTFWEVVSPWEESEKSRAIPCFAIPYAVMESEIDFMVDTVIEGAAKALV